jgi:hypothetical protein
MARLLPATHDILATVTEELTVLGGTVSDTVHDGQRLFLRALLPQADEVRPKDVVEGGIAVKAAGEKIEVCPYLFRQVCRNGALMPQVIETRHIRRVDFAAPLDAVEAVDGQLREAVRACSAAEVFADAAQQLRQAAITGLGGDVARLLLFSSLRRLILHGLGEQIVQRFLQAEDRSVFGLMNAVTSVARDQDDPEVRWRLEELGGGVAAMNFPGAGIGGSAAELVFSEA